MFDTSRTPELDARVKKHRDKNEWVPSVEQGHLDLKNDITKGENQ